jgi:uncharacterized damage-inducible protein DinB
MKALLERMLRHEHWANTRTAKVVREAEALDPSAVRLLAHLVTTDRIYLSRMREEDPWPQDFWPEIGAAECAALASENFARYAEFLARLSDADLARPVRYRNSRGDEFRTAIADMLAHVFLHGSYHRGQIAALVRRSGAEPVNTDFVVFTRECDGEEDEG